MILDKHIRKEVEKGNVAFSPMLFLGFPDIDTSRKAINIARDLGYTMFHTGIPVSKPPTYVSIPYQRHCRIASQNVTAENVLEYFSKVRPNMYSVYQGAVVSSLEDLLETMKGRVDAVIPMLDKPIPPKELQQLGRSYGIDTPGSVNPEMTMKDIETIVRYAEGFIYLRGAPNSDYGTCMYPLDLLRSTMRTIKKIKDIPVCVGVGMKTVEDVSAVASLEEVSGIIVATEMMSRLERGLDEFEHYLRPIAAATKNVKRVKN